MTKKQQKETVEQIKTFLASYFDIRDFTRKESVNTLQKAVDLLITIKELLKVA